MLLQGFLIMIIVNLSNGLDKKEKEKHFYELVVF